MRKQRGKQAARVAIHMRCSTDDQRHGDYTTIDTQREINMRKIAEIGGTLATEYSDEGKSGTNLNRQGWKALLDDAQAGCFDVVVVTYMSRLARGEAYHVAEYLLKEAGVHIELVQEKFTPDLAGHVNKQMTILMDGMYPKMVSQWTKTKMEQMVAKGYFCGGTIPFGYRTEPVIDSTFGSADKEPPKRLVPHPADAEIVQLAYSVFLDKGQIATVREFLKASTQRVWTTTTAKYLLTNEVYRGVQVFGEWRNEAAHPDIVDQDTWDAVQRLLQSRRGRRGPRSDAYAYFLRGVVTCPHCGCAFSPCPAKGGQVHYYACLHNQKLRTKCPVGRVNADALHHSVLHAIHRAVQHRTVMHEIIARSEAWSKPSEELQRARGLVARKKQFAAVKVANITKAIAEGHTNRSLYDTLSKLEQEQEELSRELVRLDREVAQSTVRRPTAAEVQEVWSQVIDLWGELTDHERTELLGTIVKDVEVKEKDRVVLRLSPIAEPHGQKSMTKSDMGAGTGFEPVTFGL